MTRASMSDPYAKITNCFELWRRASVVWLNSNSAKAMLRRLLQLRYSISCSACSEHVPELLHYSKERDWSVLGACLDRSRARIRLEDMSDLATVF